MIARLLQLYAALALWGAAAWLVPFRRRRVKIVHSAEIIKLPRRA